MEYKNKGFRKADKIVVVNKRNVASLHYGILRVGAWEFDKRLVYLHDDGSSSERPISKTLLVISKKNSAIWLQPEEVRMLKQMLDEITEQCLDDIAKSCEVVA